MTKIRRWFGTLTRWWVSLGLRDHDPEADHQPSASQRVDELRARLAQRYWY